MIGSPIGTVLFLLGVIGAAYLLAHFVVERAQQRFLFVSGIEYVGLGILLGPVVFPGMAPLGDRTAMAPIFAFAAGWVGLTYGLELERSTLRGTARAVRIALADALLTGAVVTVAALYGLGSALPGVSGPDAPPWPSALLLGTCAAAGSTRAIDLLRSRYGHDTELLPLLRRATRLGDLLAIAVLGLVFCGWHQGRTLTATPVPPLGWAVLTLGLGVGLALAFVLFVGRKPSENTLFLGAVGTLLFASGSAFFLDLSALLVNLVLGAVLAQTAIGPRLRAEIERTAAPVTLVLLVFAGALWRPVPPLAAGLVIAAFVALRTLGKVAASALATLGTPLRTDLFRGLMAQGNAAVAMAVSFRIVYGGPQANLAYTAVLVGVVVSELFSPRMVRGLLVDAGELREDLGPVGPGR